MAVQIQLDEHGPFYTSYDHVTGKVVLIFSKSQTVQSIVVKLEGESRTSFTERSSQTHGSTAVAEHHKIVYQTQQLFPATANLDVDAQSSEAKYKLEAGRYEYPFEFQFPTTNSCATGTTPDGFRMAAPHLPLSHISRQLPPSFSGVRNLVEIKYYIKVTVNRPGFFVSNHREEVNLNFLPVEPPRPPPSDTDAFVRHQHVFSEKSSRLSLSRQRSSSPVSQDAPAFEIIAQLPNPAILTCNLPIPLHIRIARQNASPENLYLLSQKIQLIGSTEVRAEGETKIVTQNHPIASETDVNEVIGYSGKTGSEVTLDASSWSKEPLPADVVPSFTTCNITQSYELETILGLGHGNSLQDAKRQTVQIPLRIPVKVYSGVAPSATMLAARNARIAGNVDKSMRQDHFSSKPPDYQPIDGALSVGRLENKEDGCSS